MNITDNGDDWELINAQIVVTNVLNMGYMGNTDVCVWLNHDDLLAMLEALNPKHRVVLQLLEEGGV